MVSQVYCYRLLAIVRDITERKRAQREIELRHQSQRTLNALLRLALQNLKLEDLLQRALALALHSPWPVTKGTGAVFLVDHTAGEIVLKAAYGMDDQILHRCARVPMGQCLCGRVAQSAEPIYCGTMDSRHAITYLGMAPHGHYCMPITAGETMLGVLNVYLEDGHPHDPAEEEFFRAFADTLAAVIVRKRAEDGLRIADAQLREQAALVKLGEMAAVVAHEVKNPLAGIRGTLQVVSSHLPPDDEDGAIMSEVITRLDALNDLMQDLLVFARPPQLRQAAVDVIELARETVALVSQDPSASSIQFEVGGESPTITADPKLLKIVLLNLVVNAAHAQENSGIIRISIETADEVCRIVVADSGPGIPPEVRDRIFVPFFTTKSRGTGLGLSTAKRLIDAHRGRIAIDCPVTGGTVVTIDLPYDPAADQLAGQR